MICEGVPPLVDSGRSLIYLVERVMAPEAAAAADGGMAAGRALAADCELIGCGDCGMAKPGAGVGATEATVAGRSTSCVRCARRKSFRV